MVVVLQCCGGSGSWFADAKELVATHEWQRVGPHDTLPAGLEIRMDLEHGGTWARLIPTPPQEESDDKQQQQEPPHAHRCGPSCHERLAQRRRGLRGGGTNHGAAAATSNNNPAANNDSPPFAPNKTVDWLGSLLSGTTIVVVMVLGLIITILYKQRRRSKLREL